MKILGTFLSVLLFSATLMGQVQTARVARHGFDSKVMFERIVSGHLTELNGKYKLRVTETVYQAGGYIGEHHHAGPGIRLVESGELTYVQSDTTRVFKAGDYFFESGDITHTAYNKTDKPVVILNFEILPGNWDGPSTIEPVKQKDP